MTKKFIPWTEADTLLAIEMLERGAAPEEFMERLGRSRPAALSRKLYYTSAEARKRAIDGSANRRLALIRGPYLGKLPPAHVMDEAERRRNAPHTITSLVCGDPPVGFRALDRRNAEPRT
jgi:hypothetical protein